MRLRALSWKARITATIGMTALGVLVISAHPSVPLPLEYHAFADRRSFWGVPNTLDVLSNSVFVVAGVAGLILLGRMTDTFRQRLERLPYLLFFVGVTLTGFGSGFYHLAPSDVRLNLDLLPMTVCFVSLVTAVIMERISIRIGAVLCGPLVLLGMTSVWYWWKGTAVGHGDIRYYLFLQFFSPVMILVMVLLFPPAYTGTGNLAAAFGMYVVAKLCEALVRAE